MPTDDLATKREEAKAALEGEEHRLKREQTAAELEVQRKAAMLAMESAEQRTHREAKARAEREATEAEARRLAEIAMIRQMEIDRAAEEKRKILEATEKKARDQELVLEKVHQAEATIENLKQEPSGINSVRTLHGDLAQAIERRKISETSIAIQQQEVGQIIIDESGRSIGKTILTIVIILLLVGGGAGVGWYAYTHQTSGIPIAIDMKLPAVVTAETILTIETASTSPQTIREKINTIYTSGKAGATIAFFASSTEFIDPETFTDRANLSIPNAVSRSMDSPFTIGAITGTDGQPNPFMITTSKNIARTIARMFDWEETAWNDLKPIWPIKAGTTTPISKMAFIDRRIANLDTRVLYDDAGRVVILYTFFNNKYLIITNNESTLNDLLRRIKP